MQNEHDTENEAGSAESRALKDAFYNRQTLTAFAEAIRTANPDFDVAAFLARVFDAEWPNRALKDRMRHVTTVLHTLLPADYRAALEILLRAAPLLPYGDFIAMIPSDYVACYGLDDYDASVAALEQFTQRVSAEFAVRPFLLRYLAEMVAQMQAWADHPSADVRRLATEGCRPRLPWGLSIPALKRDPSPILPILAKLRDDPSETVRRSVANNLNDIAKDHPDVVVETLRQWQAEQPSETLPALQRHALRSLIKAGHPGALALLGYGSAPAVTIRAVRAEPAIVPYSGEVVLHFEIVSHADAPLDLVIDYVVQFARANGNASTKVFKLARRTLMPGETARISKRHSFRPITTRRYYPGPHAIAPQVNGQTGEFAPFTLADPKP